ncbi:DUF2461 domain-containing protein [Breznakiella homolactica]|uniref:DUF2461 domain-containing protein n=1 Tax=Breznakiella homolactica TaxID=2798577 RepID=A0A7T7XKM1_9SPIR|nr:DUF2461 domain-containing protein [Breznakiella homolactica]QQO08139.1 DUF2461 domain-containing protein [Breznakiella homolactica]
MGSRIIIYFLSELEYNNSVFWMNENNGFYRDAKNEFQTLTKRIVRQISSFDESVANLQKNDVIFGLDRDTRFRREKRPYSTCFSADIPSKNNKMPVFAAYRIYIRPASSAIMGGIFETRYPEMADTIRKYMIEHCDEFLEIIDDYIFKHTFTIFGEKLRQIPWYIDTNHPLTELLMNKSWIVSYPIDNSQLEFPDILIDCIIEKFKIMQPFINFFNKALEPAAI